jgi:hypothetical protein
VTGSTDLYAEVGQSAADKLLSSVSYPFVVMERRENFPGCKRLARALEDEVYQFTDEQVDEMFRECVQIVSNRKGQGENTIHDDLLSFGGAVIQQAKRVLEAQSQEGYDGPSRKELETIVNGGVESLGENLRAIFSDFGLYAWNPHLRVTLKTRPKLKLQSPRIDLDGVKIEVLATGELWVKYPWWNCHKWCLKWVKVIKCDRIGSITVSPDIAADAHADIAARGARVYVKAAFDRLRLDYPILREIPLEGLANKVLGNKEIVVYDATALVASVPVLGSRFAVDAITLPANSTGVGIGVDIKQI